MSANSELAFQPEEWRHGNRDQQDISEPSPQRRKIKYPAVEGIQSCASEAKGIQSVAESFQKRAVIRIPAPRAIATLIINKLICVIYQRSKDRVKALFEELQRFSSFLFKISVAERVSSTRRIKQVSR